MKRAVLALSALLILASVATPAPDHVQWVKSLEDAFTKAKERGAMVFIALVINHEQDNLAQVEVFKDPAFVKASRNFVCLFGCPHPDTPQIRMKIDGEEVETCAFAPGMTRRDHIKAWDEVRAKYAKHYTDNTGGQRVPYSFVVNADGKFLAEIANGTKEGGFGVAPVGQFIQTFTELVAKYGRGLSQSDFKDFTERLEKARAQHEEGDLCGALKHVNEILGRNRTSKLADQAKEIRDAIVEVGRSRITEAEGLVDSDPPGAVLALEKVFKDFAGTDVAKEAKDALSQLKRNPKVKAAMKEIKARKEAERGIEKAEKEIAAERYGKALKILDSIARKFGGSELGDRANAMAEKIRNDPEIAKAAAEQAAAKDCKRWLSMGKTFAANGLTDKARAEFQKIIDKYPGTTYAEQAAEELGKLR